MIISDIYLTRWVENVDVYERLLSAITYIVENLDLIAHKIHMEKTPILGSLEYYITKSASACLDVLVDIFFFNFDSVSTKYFSIIVSNPIFQYRTKFCATFLIINNFLSNKTSKFEVCDKSSIKAAIKRLVGNAN